MQDKKGGSLEAAAGFSQIARELLVKFHQLLQVLEALLGGFFALGEELLGALRELADEGRVPRLVGEERLVAAVASFARKREGVLPFGFEKLNRFQ